MTCQRWALPLACAATLILPGCAGAPQRGAEAQAASLYALTACLSSVYRMLPPRYDYVAELLDQEGKGLRERGRLSEAWVRRIDAEARAFAASTPPSMAVRACSEWRERVLRED